MEMKIVSPHLYVPIGSLGMHAGGFIPDGKGNGFT